jgi:hypothetical protein
MTGFSIGMMTPSIIAAVAVLTALFSDGVTQNDMGKKQSSLAANVGYSRYFVDPEVGLTLMGITGELSWNFGKKKGDIFFKDFLKAHDVTVTYSQVIRGAVDATGVGITYGRRYQFPNLYFGFGVGPGSYWLFSRNSADPRSGYRLDTGPRLYIYYLLGIRREISEHVALTFSIKYNFTVKRVYWHNPFTPHKHRDIFHYFTFIVGFAPRL